MSKGAEHAKRVGFGEYDCSLRYHWAVDDDGSCRLVFPCTRIGRVLCNIVSTLTSRPAPVHVNVALAMKFTHICAVQIRAILELTIYTYGVLMWIHPTLVQHDFCHRA